MIIRKRRIGQSNVLVYLGAVVHISRMRKKREQLAHEKEREYWDPLRKVSKETGTAPEAFVSTLCLFFLMSAVCTFGGFRFLSSRFLIDRGSYVF